MNLKNVLAVTALLMIGILAGCKKDAMPVQELEVVDHRPLVLKAAPIGSPVYTHGQVYVSGRYMKDKNNATMNLRGHSFGWSSWWPQYWNANVVNWMADDFKVDILRASMGVDASPGYLTGDMTNQKNLVKTVVDAAIAKGVYVIIDWHCEAFHQSEAVSFFSEMAQTYGSNPNVIYEILNEPTTQTWAQVKSYAAAVIAAIRQYDSDNIIVVGCPQWDQLIRQVADSPLTGYTNIMYTVHFYAASHGQWLRDECAYAISKNIPIFVTECSGMEASGSGAINYTEWEAWFTFMEANSISWCNWSISDKVNESCSILVPGAPSNGGWTSAQMKESGNYIRTKLRSFATVAQTPYAGVITLPGKAEAENFDNGGQTVSYYDTEAANQGGTYRTSEGVDIQTCGEGGYNVGWTVAGEWLEYTVNPAAGTYNIAIRYASTAASTVEVTFSNGSKTTGNISLPSTGGWQTWATVTKTGVALNAGQQIMSVKIISGSPNLNYVNITSATPTNKLLNPGFETTANWTIESPFSRSTADKRTGSYSLRLAGVTGWKNTFQTITVTANTNYNYSVYIKGSANIYMSVYTTGWSAVANKTITPTGSWVKHTLTFNSGNNTQLIIDLQDAGNGTTYIDDTEVL